MFIQMPKRRARGGAVVAAISDGPRGGAVTTAHVCTHAEAQCLHTCPLKKAVHMSIHMSIHMSTHMPKHMATHRPTTIRPCSCSCVCLCTCPDTSACTCPQSCMSALMSMHMCHTCLYTGRGSWPSRLRNIGQVSRHMPRHMPWAHM